MGYTTKDGSYHEKLDDCTSAEEYNQHLASLEVISRPQIPQDTKRCLREEVELWSPPIAYYTNDNESINSFLKESTGYKKQQ